VRLQVPNFTLFEAKSEVEFDLKKTVGTMHAQVQVIVVAYNVTGGIGAGWRRNGLDPNTTVSFGTPPVCSDPNNRCSPIWLEPNSTIWLEPTIGHSGVDIGPTLVSLSVVPSSSRFEEAMALVTLEAEARSVPEGSYPFRMHLPVTDMHSWSYKSMAGSFNVTAVASGLLSTVTLCQVRRAGSSCDPPAAGQFVSSDDSASAVKVQVAARDSEGFELRRDGERIIVIIRRAGMAVQKIATVYNKSSSQYDAEFSRTLSGEYQVSLNTSISSSEGE
jgi:hypothetical protein